MTGRICNVRFTPQQRTSACPLSAKSGHPATSFDHLVGTGEHRCRHVETERLRGLEVDHQLVFGGRLHWKVGNLLALKNAIDVAGGATELIEEISSITDETADLDKQTGVVDCGQSVPSG